MRSQKGSVTIYVLVAMLTLTAFLMAIYIKNSNDQIAQIETTEQIKSIYEDYDVNEIHETIKNSIPQILDYEKGINENGEDIVTIKTLVKEGVNVDQNGKEIIAYAATEDTNEPTWVENIEAIALFGEWQQNNEIKILGKTVKYLWIMNEDGIISEPFEVK